MADSQHVHETYHDQATAEIDEPSQGHTVYTSSAEPPVVNADSMSHVNTSVAARGSEIPSGSVTGVSTHFGDKSADTHRAGSSATLTSSKSASQGASDDATTQIQTSQPPEGRRGSGTSSVLTASSTGEESTPDKGDFMPIKSAKTTGDPQRPGLTKRKSIATEEDLFKALSRRRTAASDIDPEEERNEVEKLMSRMFGHARQEAAEEKTRHAGVCWRDLNVSGVGLGASLQPTIGDIFMNLPRFIKNLVRKGPKAATGKPPVRKILTDFNGCVRPGEMLLVLGRPGAGCSTFLKTFCNQRAGFKEVTGDVTYGGTDAKKMDKNYRGEIIYNPEDDLHYATLSVKQTLKFALNTRAPDKNSRLEGESRSDYVSEFLRTAVKLLWIEHTVDTKVGNEYVRGVSGGERKRVSIAEISLSSISECNILTFNRHSSHEPQFKDGTTPVKVLMHLRLLNM